MLPCAPVLQHVLLYESDEATVEPMKQLWMRQGLIEVRSMGPEVCGA